MSIIILGNIIKDGIFGNLIDEVNKVEISPDGKNKILELINDLKKIIIRYVGNLLADYNNSLDKLLIGSLYSILFSSPKFIKEKNIIYFILLFIIPIIYILFSITLRTLNNLGKIDLSLYISPLFVGPKFIIYGFFISLLFYIKIKRKKYKMFDEEGYIIPIIFAKISSKIFAFWTY